LATEPGPGLQSHTIFPGVTVREKDGCAAQGVG